MKSLTARRLERCALRHPEEPRFFLRAEGSPRAPLSTRAVAAPRFSRSVRKGGQHRALTACVMLLCFSLTAVGQSAPSEQSHPAQASKPWQQIPIHPLPPFHPQQPKRIELSNGMVIFLQEDHELPLIDASARIRGGSVYEPAD